MAATTVEKPAETQSGSGSLPQSSRLASHRILERLDRDRRGLEILHKDLFDSDQRIVLSALAAVSLLRDKRSLQLIARLAASEDETVRAAAAEALGAMGFVEAAKVLRDLFKLSRSEVVRKSALEALVRLTPDAPGMDDMLREQTASHLVPAELRAAAAAALVRRKGAPAVQELLAGASGRVLDVIYESSPPEAAAALAAHAAKHWGDFSPENRIRAIRVVSPFVVEGGISLLLQALQDEKEEVREVGYQEIGREGQGPQVAAIVAFLASRVDPVPVLEEAALAAIERLEDLATAQAAGRERILVQIQESHKILASSDRQVASDSHELGWMIARSREYLEYYADEALRQGVVGFLKGSSNYSADDLLEALKRSAVKVEVRHFDGYTALADLFKNPQRSGLGLISRELAIAKLGKRAILYRLIRNLRLSRLYSTGGLKLDPSALFAGIFSWAYEAKLYRLAEAALYALAKVDGARAATLCEACLKPPLTSKICAIASIRLLRELNASGFESAILPLIAPSGDPYVLLNLLDALTADASAAGAQVVKAALALLRGGDNQEVLQEAATFLAHRPSPELLQGLAAFYEPAPAWKRGLILGVLERWTVESKVPDREGLVELLYRVLRLPETGANRARAAAVLWRLGDDYAPKLLAEIASGADAVEKVQAVRSLKGAVTPALAPFLRALLSSDQPDLQQAITDTALSATGEAVCDRMRDIVLALRGEPGGGDNGAQEPYESDGELKIDLAKEKKSFRFEKEHLQELAVFFSDIQGYSKKAEALSSMELTALIQEYEGILVPAATSHRGELIKKMGDGHLFIFASALDAVLAAIRVQKALKRFNSYREERSRVVIRIGVHWGKVVRKEGDVLGNHVNIASRLETSCTGGSVLVSDAVYWRLEGHVHARELGAIQVKNIAEPIKVYEPYEIALELPESLDPLRIPGGGAAAQPQAAPEAAAPEAAAPEPTAIPPAAVAAVVETFSRLNGLCKKVEQGEVAVGEIRKELGRRWAVVRAALGISGKA